ncbi:MAG: FkbM family methyltransferase [Thalassobaculaceae bacterium]|nr:FkbM family methyltransferase [Thalassobaculaceae bacterium]
MKKHLRGTHFRKEILSAPDAPESYAVTSTNWAVFFDPEEFKRCLGWAALAGVDQKRLDRARHFQLRLDVGRAARRSAIARPVETLTLDVDGESLNFVYDERVSGNFFRRVLKQDDGGRYLAHEPALLRSLRSSLGPRSVLIDIGAHVGYFALYAARLGASVVAVEMQQTLCDAIRLNAAANEFWRIQTLCAAIGGRPDMAQLIRLNPQPGMQVQSEKAATGWVPFDSLNHDVIPILTLDQMLPFRQMAWVRNVVVKIDVEGAEAGVLSGAKEAIAKRLADFIVEIHPDGLSTFGSTVGDVLGAFPAKDWRALLLEDDGEREVGSSEIADVLAHRREITNDPNVAVRYTPR